MIIKQYFLGCLAHASYMIGDEQSHTAVVIDPQRDIDQYLIDAKKLGVQIRFVFLTHFHADFLAGHLELRDKTGAEICLGSKAKAEYPFRVFHDGDMLEFGGVRLHILETPGHTLESICILAFDLKQQPGAPQAVFTGDTLFIGDVGRPDLMASVGVTAEELAGMLYDSLNQKILPLPNDTLVYPAHGAGSMCGKHLSSDTVSTIKTQRHYNYALQPMSRETFILLVTTNQPEAPRYFGYDARLNRMERPLLEDSLRKELNPLALEEVLELHQAGAQLLDVRDAADFAGSHLTGSLNIGLGGKFATWAGILVDREHPIVIIAEPSREQEAIRRLGRIGFDHVVGFLETGMNALARRPDLIRRINRMTVGTLDELVRTPHPPRILDVRSESEWEAGHIDHSINIPLSHLQHRRNELTEEPFLVVHCASGYRSSTAASLLEMAGLTTVTDLIGGYDAWQQYCGGRSSTA